MVDMSLCLTHSILRVHKKMASSCCTHKLSRTEHRRTSKMFESLVAIVIYAHAIVEASGLTTHQSALPDGWTSVGCYTDDTASRTLKIASTTDVTGMTIEECLTFCTPAGYQFAGVEFGRECYCDNIVESPGVPATDGCDMPCTGNSAEICGGANRINIFNNTAISHPPPPPVANIKPTVGNFQYRGCFFDGVNGAARSLLHQVSVTGGVSAESCTAACNAAGFPLAGLEFGQECWCDTYMPFVISAPDSDCNMACQADATEICGSGNRLAVYQDTTASPPTGCLTNAQFFSQSQPYRFNVKAVPFPGGGAGSTVVALELSHDRSQPVISLMTVGGVGTQTNIFNFQVNTFWPNNVGDGLPAARRVASPNGAQSFVAFRDFTFTPDLSYCVMPNPVGIFGPFIGPPTIAVFGHNDLWSLCSGGGLGNLPTVIYQAQPTAGETCQNVVLTMVPPGS